MRLIMVGCEYSGVRTLSQAILGWSMESMGAFLNLPEEYRIHDHFRIPEIGHPPALSKEEHAQINNLTPRLKEMIQRWNVFYHIPWAPNRNDVIFVGLYFEDNVYGPLYFDYIKNLGPDDPIMQTRNQFDKWFAENSPETVLVHVKCSPEQIRYRKKTNPHEEELLKDEDVEYVLERFEQEFGKSIIKNKIVLDTTNISVEESLDEFKIKIVPFLTENDKNRIGN